MAELLLDRGLACQQADVVLAEATIDQRLDRGIQAREVMKHCHHLHRSPFVVHLQARHPCSIR
ncbi:MAG: hypothetical protein HC871_09080 [Rhizobiales bacterium]|nr:hypothetical protein [Hyphomicrobiales bacterium]